MEQLIGSKPMSRMKLLMKSLLWQATLDLTDSAGEAFRADVSGSKARALDDLMAEVIHVSSSVTLGLEERSREAKIGHLESARRRLGVLAARVHVAESMGVVSREMALEIRTRVRYVADEADLEMYRSRRRAG